VTYSVTFSSQARRALTVHLPEAVASACFEFISGALAENPYRVVKPMREPMAPLYSARRGEFRVIYNIHEDRVLVHVVTVKHRRDAYRR
jgi:mRNA interferase RelE/StbE